MACPLRRCREACRRPIHSGGVTACAPTIPDDGAFLRKVASPQERAAELTLELGAWRLGHFAVQLHHNDGLPVALSGILAVANLAGGVAVGAEEFSAPSEQWFQRPLNAQIARYRSRIPKCQNAVIIPAALSPQAICAGAPNRTTPPTGNHRISKKTRSFRCVNFLLTTSGTL